MASASLIPEAMRAEIARNYIASEREARFAFFHAGAFLVLLLVSLGAVLVDYMIVSEFWTRALANEFLELPGTLASSVAFKSLQVLFATIAAHILYEHMGRFGRGFFVRAVFVLALAMLVGVGLLLATMSLPNGLAATGAGSGVGSSLGSALAGLGIEAPATGDAASVSSELDAVRSWQPFFWLGSLGVVFLVVTGVAALCIHFATEELRRIVLARDFAHRRRDMARLAALEAEYDEIRQRLSEMEGPENRRHLLWTGLMREARAYEQGLDEARRALPLAARTPRLIGRGAQVTGPAADRLKGCEASRDVTRYERLFDEWWERRSRNAMKAGPTASGGMREPFGEVLPPLRAPRPIGFERAAE
ncbi:MAG: hypothetical protein WBG82_07640 [Parvibaculum sp.]|uniref:hypothetical protein n=1 Tax=Parvibaculum sp. TaxID=2024848 RepID=UPI003C742A9C